MGDAAMTRMVGLAFAAPGQARHAQVARVGDCGSPSECDGKFHDNSKPVVSLSTGWYASESRCGRRIRITASDGRSVVAHLVDECDSINRYDSEHAGQPPCRNNTVDGSNAVWNALGLDIDIDEVKVTWSMI
ncbi:hypothetical protein RJ641_008485 [Dillenia turbinata]|uniref:RlpA-like protein double-psi beta-barrel domain-containing protein n=1 Tax=Dillenia turbinata TaxID=194707 RepID=A0AAN8VB01_9MAGN